MKKYKVVLQPLSLRRVRQIDRWGALRWPPDVHARWLDQLEHAIASLDTLPERHPIAPDREAFVEEIRQIIVEPYRILYTIKKNEVHIVTLRRTSQKRLFS